MSQDVTVLGMMVPTCVIHDITMDVPHGCTIVIPWEKAHVSKDLWRLIGQRCLFQMRAGPNPQPFPRPPTPVPPPDLSRITDRQQALEEENVRLREKLAQYQLASEGKLDAILGLLQSGALSVGTGHQSAAKVSISSVDGAAPTFIPTTITPENAQSRIEAKKEESTSMASSSASKLRELKNKKSGQ